MLFLRATCIIIVALCRVELLPSPRARPPEWPKSDWNVPTCLCHSAHWTLQLRTRSYSRKCEMWVATSLFFPGHFLLHLLGNLSRLKSVLGTRPLLWFIFLHHNSLNACATSVG